jgi:hypothetical protein
VNLNDITRTVYRLPGILGVFRGIAEVTAVYPTISSTVQPHRTDITFRQGDAFEINVTVQDDSDDPHPVNIDRCLLRFAAKLGSGVVPGDIAATIGLDGAHVVKQSSNPAEIAFAGPGNARIVIGMADTIAHPLNTGYAWDLQVIRPTEQRNMVGAVRIKNNENIVMGFGTDFTAVAVGDIFEAQGKKALVTEVLSADTIRVACSSWVDERRAPYAVWRTESRVVASGRWMCVGNTASP